MNQQDNLSAPVDAVERSADILDFQLTSNTAAFEVLALRACGASEKAGAEDTLWDDSDYDLIA